jgi:hypothetical protein
MGGPEGQLGCGAVRYLKLRQPGAIRFRKYATGTHVIVHGTEVEAGLTPKETVWQRGLLKVIKKDRV